MESDAALIAASATDPQLFTAIFERHARAIYRYLATRVGGPDVEDLLSEVFLTAFRRRDRYDAAYADARPWLFGIATNAVHHQMRSANRRRAMMRRLERDLHGRPSWTDDPETGLDAKDIERIHRALAGLDEKYRDVLLLLSGAELTYEEIARALGIPLGTVRSRIARGRARLRELLEVDGKNPFELSELEHCAAKEEPT